MEDGIGNIWVFKGIRDYKPAISFYKPQKNGRPIYVEINVGIDWLMEKIKEDDALLAEFFVLRMHGFKD